MQFVFARDRKKKTFSIAPTEWCPQQNKQANGRRATMRSFRAPPSSCVHMCIHACVVYVEGRRGGERLQVRIDTIEWCLTCYDLSKPRKHMVTCVCVCLNKEILATLQYTFYSRINPYYIWAPANMYAVYVLGNMVMYENKAPRCSSFAHFLEVITWPFKNAWAP